MKEEIKGYEVVIKAYAIVLVIGAEDEEDAFEMAEEHVRFGSFELDEMSIDEEFFSQEKMDSARKYISIVVSK